MIDIENELFTTVKAALSTEYPNAAVSGVTTFAPPSFPFVCFEEIDNYVSKTTIDSARVENFARVTYEVNIYSNKTSGGKSEAKAILSVIDECLGGLGFCRGSATGLVDDNTKTYRIICRYTATVSTNQIIYGGN